LGGFAYVLRSCLNFNRRLLLYYRSALANGQRKQSDKGFSQTFRDFWLKPNDCTSDDPLAKA